MMMTIVIIIIIIVVMLPNIPENVCVTQGNEDAGSVQDFILLFLCLV